MKTLKIYILVAICFISPATYSQIDYFGQTPPGDSAIVFAPGIISQANRSETGIAISPNNDEVYIAVWGDSCKIYYTKYKDNSWSKQEEVKLLDAKFVSSPFLSKDGNKLYFTDWENIYKADRINEGWSTPEALPSPFNSDHNDYYYTESNEGVAYITSDRPGKSGNYGDNWYVKQLPDSTNQAINLGNKINSSTSDDYPLISPDGSYLIFASNSTRYNRYGYQDLFICFIKDTNSWTNPLNLEETDAGINLPGWHQAYPALSKNEKYLFFCRHPHSGSGETDLFWVSTSIISDLKKMFFAPKVADSISDMNISTDSTLSYIIPENTFKCEYGVENLIYTASLEDESALPEGLTFSTNTLLGKPTETGEFNIKITATNRDTVSVSDVFKLTIVQGITAIKNTLKKEVFVYPNPAHNKIFIESTEFDIINSHYKIISITGTTLQEGYLSSNSIDISELKTGTYLLQLKTKAEVITRKVVVE